MVNNENNTICTLLAQFERLKPVYDCIIKWSIALMHFIWAIRKLRQFYWVSIILSLFFNLKKNLINFNIYHCSQLHRLGSTIYFQLILIFAYSQYIFRRPIVRLTPNQLNNQKISQMEMRTVLIKFISNAKNRHFANSSFVNPFDIYSIYLCSMSSNSKLS